VGILGYVIAAAVQALAQSHRMMVGSLALAAVEMSGRMVGPMRSHSGGRVDRTGRTGRIVVLVNGDHKADSAYTRPLGRGSVRVNLVGNHLVARMAFHIALD
jgi:hypothetical protein